jgi:hypothetical protein
MPFLFALSPFEFGDFILWPLLHLSLSPSVAAAAKDHKLFDALQGSFDFEDFILWPLLHVSLFPSAAAGAMPHRPSFVLPPFPQLSTFAPYETHLPLFFVFQYFLQIPFLQVILHNGWVQLGQLQNLMLQ